MKRFVVGLGLVVALTAELSAHFVFIVPTPTREIRVVFSETTEIDEGVTTDAFSELKLQESLGGKTQAVTTRCEKHCWKGSHSKDATTVFGEAVYGVSNHGGKAALLTYYPKAILGNTEDKPSGKNPEIVRINKEGKLYLQFLVNGKPEAGAEGTIISGGKKEKIKTDAEGKVGPYPKTPLIAAWFRNVEAKEGEHNGKKYVEIRRYATLVMNTTPKLPSLPRPSASLGAIASDDFIYVYGGHVGKTHVYSTADVVGTFHRIKATGGEWEELTGGPALQGMNLATEGGKIYRIGGMSPRNAPGTDADNHSTAVCAVYCPKEKTWKEMAPLPEPRSSHDVVVVDKKLYVVGGWNQIGKMDKAKWASSVFVLDLEKKDAKWETLPQPFQRRALTAAAVGKKIYVLGGLDEDTDTHQTVDIFDVATGKWSKGADLPGKKTGFGSAATVHQGRLVVSTTDGKLHRLKTDGSAWETVATDLKVRMVHRAVSDGDNVILVGGAIKGDDLADVEVIPLTQ